MVAALIAAGFWLVGATVYALVRAYFFRAISPAVLAPREPVRPLADLRASTCGACHPSFLAEWSASAHGRAMTDPFFLAEYEVEHRLFACLRCHAPLTEQQPTLVSGFASLGPPRPQEVPNPRHDPALTQEGVTCVVCHQQGAAIEGPLALDVSTIPHATRVNTAFGANELCARCHAAEAFPGAKLQRELLGTLAEHAVWRSQGGTQRCVECHMPPVERALTTTTPARHARSHALLGPRDREFVRAYLSIEDPRCTVEAQRLRCEVALRNGAGHRLPTAEPGRDLVVSLTPEQGEAAHHHIRRWMDRVALREPPGEDNTLLPMERRSVALGGPSVPSELSVRLCLFVPDDPLLRATRVPWEASCETLGRWTVDARGTVTPAPLPDDGLRGRY